MKILNKLFRTLLLFWEFDFIDLQIMNNLVPTIRVSHVILLNLYVFNRNIAGFSLYHNFPPSILSI